MCFSLSWDTLPPGTPTPAAMDSTAAVVSAAFSTPRKTVVAPAVTRINGGRLPGGNFSTANFGNPNFGVKVEIPTHVWW